MRVNPHVGRYHNKERRKGLDSAVNFGICVFSSRDGFKLVSICLSVGKDLYVDVVVHEHALALGLVPTHPALPVKLKAILKENTFKNDGLAHRALAADGESKHVVAASPVAHHE